MHKNKKIHFLCSQIYAKFIEIVDSEVKYFQVFQFKLFSLFKTMFSVYTYTYVTLSC